MPLATTDVSDAHPEAQICDPVFLSWGARPAFSGPITTLKVFEDNTLVRAAVEQPGEGRVLVVEGGGSLRCAMFGGTLGVLAADNGWAGVVVNGAVRDVDELDAQPIGIPVVFAGVVFREGEWLLADRDGVLVLPQEPV
jgi:regulator of ribonuclease activity A